MKKILYVFFTVLLVVNLTACNPAETPTLPTEAPTVPTDAATEPATGGEALSGHRHCLCVGMAKNLGEHTTCTEDALWLPVSTKDELVAAFADPAKPAWIFLEADITVEEELTALPGAQISICLNGKTLKCSVQSFGATLNITDCGETGTLTTLGSFAIRTNTKGVTNLFNGHITSSGKAEDVQLMIIDGTDSLTYELEEDEAFLNIYGGKISNPYTSTKVGANIWAGLRAVIHMYGGEIGPCTVRSQDNSNGDRIGGSISLWGRYSEMTMSGGTITGGKITTVKDGSATKSGRGGNIGIYAGALTVTGGTIKDGYSSGSGGNIGTLITGTAARTIHIALENCVLSGGKCASFGGNAYFNTTDPSLQTVSFKNVTITAGEAPGAGGNLFFQEGGAFLLENCTVTDGVSTNERAGGIALMTKGFQVTLKGKNIFKNNFGSDIFFRDTGTNNAVLSIAGVTNTYREPIIVCSGTQNVPFTVDTVADALNVFLCPEGYTITEADGKLKLTVDRLPEAGQTNVAQPLTKEALEAIPIANSSMTNEELRKIIVDFMRAQCTFAWTPSEMVTFAVNKTGLEMTLEPGKVYGGNPYVGSKNGTLYSMMHFYDDRNGEIDFEALFALNQEWQDVIANVCSSSTLWAWRRVTNSITSVSTYTMIPNRGVVPVGVYDASELEAYRALENTGVKTKEICAKNGQQVMYEAYAQMKMADGVMYLDTTTADGHVIMISSNPVVVRNPDGTIDGKNSTITYLDQTYTLKKYDQGNGVDKLTFGNFDKVWTFEKLYSVGGLPWTLPELAGTDPVEDGTLTSSHTGETVNMSQLQNMMLTANYAMTYTTIKIRNAAGQVIYTGHSYITNHNLLKTKAFSDTALDVDEIRAFANGVNTIEVSARISNGAEIVAYTGVFVP